MIGPVPRGTPGGSEVGGAIPEPSVPEGERPVRVVIDEVPVEEYAFFPNAAACWKGAKPPQAQGPCVRAPDSFRARIYPPCTLATTLRGGLPVSQYCPRQ